MKGYYTLKYLQELALRLPKIDNGFKLKRYNKKGRDLNKEEKAFIEKTSAVLPHIEYKFIDKIPIYLNHLANLRNLNKKPDAVDQISKYEVLIKKRNLNQIKNRSNS